MLSGTWCFMYMTYCTETYISRRDEGNAWMVYFLTKQTQLLFVFLQRKVHRFCLAASANLRYQKMLFPFTTNKSVVFGMKSQIKGWVRDPNILGFSCLVGCSEKQVLLCVVYVSCFTPKKLVANGQTSHSFILSQTFSCFE